ncbi:hypothetical protein CIT292_07124 [Citrobacter youngae ATCC 29220]|uniref:Uncharacterized protein n=1 Tax=Citrobacter youngae ATCC 29220 TaxID=500640 RepID=D4B9I4_9ENTR|nr:hypothetical protein CIT292_07124 [Citrobacter youngae ATCC 29220]
MPDGASLSGLHQQNVRVGQPSGHSCVTLSRYSPCPFFFSSVRRTILNIAILVLRLKEH